MKLCQKYWRPAMLTFLIMLMAVPVFSQVPRAVLAELGSATW